jgi:hypothetical protein
MFKIFTFLTSFPAALFANFLALFGRKFTVATAAVLAMIATTVTMVVCLKSILTGVTALLVIPSWIYTAIAWFIPSNFIAVVSAILSGKICKQAYLLVQNKIDLITKAN